MDDRILEVKALRDNKALQEVSSAGVTERSAAAAIIERDIHVSRITQFLLKSFSRGKWLFNVEAIVNNYPCICDWKEAAPWKGMALFVCGDKSGYVPEAHYPAIYRQFPLAQVTTVANTGHWLHHEKPDTLLEQIRGALDQNNFGINPEQNVNTTLGIKGINKMAQVGIFYGSDTGNTEAVAAVICQELGENCSGPYDIAKSSQGDLERFDRLLLGIPTWYYGEIQCDWDDFLPTLEKINFKNKQVAIFGCGDQEDYAEYFCDAMGKIADTVRRRGADLVGQWPTAGYFFEASRAIAEENYFVGLAIDEDRQPELTAQRVKSWVEQIKREMGFNA